jgi:hypothetical protein
MAYVIVGLIVLVLVGGFAVFLAGNAARRSKPSTADEGRPPGIGPDHTPLGDSSEHAGTHDDEGRTVGDPEAPGRAPARAGGAPATHPGEAEGAERRAPGPHPPRARGT